MNPTSKELAQRIRKGVAWLNTHSITYCEEYDTTYDHKRFVKNLAVYEGLVDQARALGMDEETILKDPAYDEELSDDQVIDHLVNIRGKKCNL